MKKWFLSVAVLATVTACSSSNESRQVANDSYEKNAESKINFSPLATGGVTIVGS